MCILERFVEGGTVRIKFLGAAREVTGSRHTISIPGESVLLDCGLYQGKRKLTYERNKNIPRAALNANAMLLGHAHIDHSGNIPNLVSSGFRGKIYATSATVDLCRFMLLDSAYLQEKDVEYVNKRRRRRGEELVEPLYTSQDTLESLNLFVSKPYNRWFRVTKNISAKFCDAGHVLGSAVTVLRVKDRGKLLKIGYAVDLGRKRIPILRDPVQIKGVDYLIIESTYGNRLHEKVEESEKVLEDTVNRIVRQKGKLIIPSFTLERTQEVVYHLHSLIEEKRIPAIPIFVDSPLAVNITSVFRRHPECFDKETMRLLRGKSDPFGFDYVTYIHEVDRSKALNEMEGPMVIISASGMAEGGRILHHLKNNIESPRNIIMIVGYMAANTLGRRLVEKEKQVKIFGELYTRKADVVVANSFSAHADRNGLIEYVTGVGKGIKHIFIVHGEESQAIPFAEALREMGYSVTVPHLGDEVKLP